MTTTQQESATLEETRARLEAFLSVYFCERLAALRDQPIEHRHLEGLVLQSCIIASRDDRVSRREP